MHTQLEKLIRDLDLITCKLIWFYYNLYINILKKKIFSHYHFIRKYIINGSIYLEYVLSVEKNIDFFIKPLRKSLFKKFRTGLGLYNYNKVNQPLCKQTLNWFLKNT